MSEELDSAIHSKITELCQLGDSHVEEGELDLALAKYQEALTLIPAPHARWQASTWVWTAIGDTYFMKGDFEQSLDAFRAAMRGPDAIGNPFIHLRLGQSAFETGDMETAREHLLRAYMAEGIEIFEDERPDYLDLIKPLID